MSRRIIPGALLAMILLGAWQWPLDPQLLSTGFGSLRSTGGLERGLRFDADGEDVSAVADGTVVFREKGESGGEGLPGKGGIVVLDHENGFRSIYSGLRAEGLTRGERILSGRSIGRAGPGAVRVEIWDRTEGWYANPLLLLEILPDERAPVVSDIRIVSERDETVQTSIPSYNRAAHPAGEAEVHIRLGGESGLARSSRVQLTRGGVTVHEVVAERIVSEEVDRLVWSQGERSADELYDEDGWLRLGGISVPEGGRTSFTVRAFDSRGGQQTRLFTVDGVAAD